jgi:plastocyanin
MLIDLTCHHRPTSRAADSPDSRRFSASGCALAPSSLGTAVPTRRRAADADRWAASCSTPRPVISTLAMQRSFMTTSTFRFIFLSALVMSIMTGCSRFVTSSPTDFRFVVGIKADSTGFVPQSLAMSPNTSRTLSLQNPTSSLAHTWVLINGDLSVAASLAEDSTQFAPGYIPVKDSRIIAYIPIVQPGEQGTTTFTIEKTGHYIFFCTIPGHLQKGMYGSLDVK